MRGLLESAACVRVVLPGHVDRGFDAVLLRDIGVQRGQVRAEDVRGLRRCGKDGGMERSAGDFSTDADPSQRRIEIAGLCVAQACVGEER